MLSEAFSTSLTSALIGAVAGAMGALLMALISWLTTLGWGDAVLLGQPANGPQALQLLLPLGAGLAIGLLRQRGADPLPELHSTIEELHEHGEHKLQPHSSHWLLGLLALVGGGSLGPEALLSRCLAEWSIGLSRWGWFKAIPWRGASAISGSLGLFGLPLVGGVALAERPDRPLPAGLWQWLPGVVSGIAGFAVFQGFSRFGDGEQSVRYLWPHSLEEISQNLVWALLLGLIGGVLGLLFLGLRRHLVRTLKRWNPLSQALLTGGVLAAMSQLQPLALMSGELQITPLLQGALVTNGHTLVLLGLLKLGLCALCLSSGWIGGQFFPLIFGASAIGMGLGELWPQVVPGQVAVSSLTAAIQSAVLGQALLPLLITAAVLKGHALAGALIGSVMGLGVRQITNSKKRD